MVSTNSANQTKTEVANSWSGRLSRKNLRAFNHHYAELQCIRIDVHGENEFVSAMKMNMFWRIWRA